MIFSPYVRPALASLIGACALIFSACSSPDPQPEAPRPRNVILIVTDTLRADRLGSYGYSRSTSPNIDALAERGTQFTRNHSQGSWTVPSMISLMSGLYVTQEETSLPTDQPTLGEALDSGGIQTVAFIGNPVVSGDRGFHRGFEEDFYTASAGTEASGPRHLPSGSALQLVASFESWYTQNEADLATGKGFVAWIHPMDPHLPYRPKVANPFPLGSSRMDTDLITPRWQEGEIEIENLLQGREHRSYLSSTQMMNYRSNQYDGEVFAVDEAVGNLLAFLEQEAVLDETLIIFAADHGEMLWEQKLYDFALALEMQEEKPLEIGVYDYFGNGHRGWFYEQIWNTPLILMGPGIEAGVVSNDLSTNLDIYPTILDALDLPTPNKLHGTSLMDNKAPVRERVFGFGNNVTAVFESSGQKLIEAYTMRPSLGEEKVPEILFFDLEVDPTESTNMASGRAADVERLRAELESWRMHYDREVDMTTSEESEEVLGALGYLD
jgi:arylsulfatase A-like enzyme